MRDTAPVVGRKCRCRATTGGWSGSDRGAVNSIYGRDAMADISVRALGKHFGSVVAVQDLTFDVPAGRITGFLGPNGAGKTTTLRMMLGLVRPTSGQALIAGRRYDQLTEPRRTVGAVLEATGFHPGRRGRDHLRVAAHAAGIPTTRVDEVLDLVGLTDDARRRVRGYSLGMRQRLGLAVALLGDPRVLILDEPANGLDPAGMAWLRELLRDVARTGRTVIVSSHVLSEVAQTVDHVVIIHRGRLRFDGPLRELADTATGLEAAFLSLTDNPTDPPIVMAPRPHNDLESRPT
jgi:ABC-2 type transport system ATP-binding protein